MRRWLRRLLSGRVAWAPVPDHESRSLLCRLAWHSWVVTTHEELDRDDVDGGARLVVVGRTRECRSCGRVEDEVRL